MGTEKIFEKNIFRGGSNHKKNKVVILFPKLSAFFCVYNRQFCLLLLTQIEEKS